MLVGRQLEGCVLLDHTFTVHQVYSTKDNPLCINAQALHMGAQTSKKLSFAEYAGHSGRIRTQIIGYDKDADGVRKHKPKINSERVHHLLDYRFLSKDNPRQSKDSLIQERSLQIQDDHGSPQWFNCSLIAALRSGITPQGST